MRLLPISLLYGLLASVVVSESAEAVARKNDAQVELAEDVNDGPSSTIFNGIKVPVLTEMDGEKFNTTIKSGYWFVKHHS